MKTVTPTCVVCRSESVTNKKIDNKDFHTCPNCDHIWPVNKTEEEFQREMINAVSALFETLGSVERAIPLAKLDEAKEGLRKILDDVLAFLVPSMKLPYKDRVKPQPYIDEAIVKMKELGNTYSRV